MGLNSVTPLGHSAGASTDEEAKPRPFWRRAGSSFHGDSAASGQPKSPRHLPISYRGITGLALGLDFLLIVGVGLLSGALYHELAFGGPGELRRQIAVAAFVALTFVGIARLNKLYNPSQLRLWNVQLHNVIWIWCSTFFLLSGWLFVWKTGDEISRGAVLSFWGLGLLILLPQRAIWRFFIERALKSGSLRGRKAIVIARNSTAIDPEFVNSLGRYGYDMMREFIVCGSSAKEINDVLASVVSFVHGSEVEEILLIVKSDDMPKLGRIVDRLRILPIPVTWVADGSMGELVRQPWFELGSAVAVEMQRSPRSKTQRAVKRAVDIVGASCGLFLLFPLYIVVALAIKIDSPGPIFFSQTRRGFNGKTFKIFKFRSMTVLEDGEVIKQATKNDARVTRVGAWIRRTSIDEMPQLFNVLRGCMSLVGPRPHAVAHDDRFFETVEHYAYRNHVKPGITGWAQIHGYRGETPTLEAIQRRVELDRWYINNWSTWLDFLIMLRTLGEFTRGQKVY